MVVAWTSRGSGGIGGFAGGLILLERWEMVTVAKGMGMRRLMLFGEG